MERNIRSTRHGPLIDDAIRAPQISPIMLPQREYGNQEYGLAFSWTATEPDQTFDAILGIMKSKSMREAMVYARDVRFVHLNLLVADKTNIGWQVTGLYPRRKKGVGHFVSLGWTGEYDWDGFVERSGGRMTRTRKPVTWHPPILGLGTTSTRYT